MIKYKLAVLMIGYTLSIAAYSANNTDALLYKIYMEAKCPSPFSWEKDSNINKLCMRNISYNEKEDRFYISMKLSKKHKYLDGIKTTNREQFLKEATFDVARAVGIRKFEKINQHHGLLQFVPLINVRNEERVQEVKRLLDRLVKEATLTVQLNLEKGIKNKIIACLKSNDEISIFDDPNQPPTSKFLDDCYK